MQRIHNYTSIPIQYIIQDIPSLRNKIRFKYFIHYYDKCRFENNLNCLKCRSTEGIEPEKDLFAKKKREAKMHPPARKYVNNSVYIVNRL